MIGVAIDSDLAQFLVPRALYALITWGLMRIAWLNLKKRVWIRVDATILTVRRGDEGDKLEVSVSYPVLPRDGKPATHLRDTFTMRETRKARRKNLDERKRALYDLKQIPVWYGLHKPEICIHEAPESLRRKVRGIVCLGLGSALIVFGCYCLAQSPFTPFF